jgi:hypothetical protein
MAGTQLTEQDGPRLIDVPDGQPAPALLEVQDAKVVGRQRESRRVGAD